MNNGLVSGNYIKSRDSYSRLLILMNPIKIATSINHQDGKILATQRGYGEYKGLWEFPGGKMEPGETEEQAIVREIREELNVEVGVEKKVCTVEYDYPAFHLTMHCFWCNIRSGVVELKEHQSAQWLSPSEWESVEWLPADVLVIDALKKSFQSNQIS